MDTGLRRYDDKSIISLPKKAVTPTFGPRKILILWVIPGRELKKTSPRRRSGSIVFSVSLSLPSGELVTHSRHPCIYFCHSCEGRNPLYSALATPSPAKGIKSHPAQAGTTVFVYNGYRPRTTHKNLQFLRGPDAGVTIKNRETTKNPPNGGILFGFFWWQKAICIISFCDTSLVFIRGGHCPTLFV